MRSLIVRLRQRRTSLSWQVRHRNPRGLTRSQYVAELEVRDATIAAVLREDYEPPSELEIRQARAAAARRAHQGPPPLTREQEVARLRAEAMRQAGSDVRGYGRVV